MCRLVGEVQAYLDAAVAEMQGEEAAAADEHEEGRRAPPTPLLRPVPDLERFLNEQLGGLAQRVGRAPQSELEAPLRVLEGSGAAAQRLPKTYLARHLRWGAAAESYAVALCPSMLAALTFPSCVKSQRY